MGTNKQLVKCKMSLQTFETLLLIAFVVGGLLWMGLWWAPLGLIIIIALMILFIYGWML